LRSGAQDRSPGHWISQCHILQRLDAPFAIAMSHHRQNQRVDLMRPGRIYLRLLDAEAVKADWREVARIVLQINPDKESERAYRSWQSHLARAHWMTKFGYRYLLSDGAPH
jgi:hypothetical protein